MGRVGHLFGHAGVVPEGGHDLGGIRIIDDLPAVGRIVAPCDLLRVLLAPTGLVAFLVPLLVALSNGGGVDHLGVIVDGGKLGGVTPGAIGVGHLARSVGRGAPTRVLPSGWRGDLLWIRADGLSARARVKELRPVDGDVVELAGGPADGTHQIRDDQGG